MQELDLILTWIERGEPVNVENQEIYKCLVNYINNSIATSLTQDDSRVQLDMIASMYYSIDEANYGGKFDLPLKKQCASAMVNILSKKLTKYPDDEEVKFQIQYWQLVERYTDYKSSYLTYIEKGHKKAADNYLSSMKDIEEQMEEIALLQVENVSKHKKTKLYFFLDSFFYLLFYQFISYFINSTSSNCNNNITHTNIFF